MCLTRCRSRYTPWILGVEVEESPGFALDLKASPSLRWNAQLLIFALKCAQWSGHGGGEGCVVVVKPVGRDGRLLGIPGKQPLNSCWRKNTLWGHPFENTKGHFTNWVTMQIKWLKIDTIMWCACRNTCFLHTHTQTRVAWLIFLF